MTDPVTTNGTQAVTTGWPAELSEEYDFLGELGRGGMAVVYRARERSLGREVAVKVVRPRFHSDEESVARLAREARTVAQLEHPNIVSLHGIRRLNNGLALVMQLVPGQTLKAAIASGGLSIERAEQILRDIARALAYAHRCGVVHRDVKPENIFLDDITGRALLSDFGVARSITENSELTATGTAIGTPTYMSPEQIDGGALDGRSDLYALGMVAWEMLTAQRPWFGESLYSVIYRQKHDSLPPLDVLRPDVPPRLQFLIEGLMQKKPDDRWPGAARFLTLLNSTDKLPGFKEWQSAAKKRRKTGSHKAVMPTADVQRISPVSSTVQFRRGETPAGTVPASANSQSITPHTNSGAGIRISPSVWSNQAIPTKPTPNTRRRWIWGAFGAMTLAGAAIAFAIMTRPPVRAPQNSAALSDKAGVEVPILPPKDTQNLVASAGVDSLKPDTLRLVDSTKLATAPIPPVISKDTAKRPITPPTVRPTPTNVAATNGDSARPPVTDVAAVAMAPDRLLIAAGQNHSCALAADGHASCWGNNENGQLGDGSTTSSANPKPVAGDFVFASITAGQSHSCGVSRDGDALCWGLNASGQLGDGTSSPRSAPVRVASGSFRFVRAGQSHSCGLTRSGAVLCWGNNTRGQLGDGSRSSKSTPVAVALGASAGAIAVGSSHSCAITTAGQAFCWGRNEYGQLGDGTSGADKASPVPVSTDAKFVSISAGTAHTCGVTTDGVVLCWGRNQYGQLGAGNTIDASTPQRVESSASFSTVSLGLAHSCARTRDGRAMCWGRNAYGQLGDGTTEDRARPTGVRGVSAFTALNASGSHTCAVSGGESYCWGYNVDGQLGVGDRENVSTPTRVASAAR